MIGKRALRRQKKRIPLKLFFGQKTFVHIAATPLGMAVTAEATLVDIFQNRLAFEVAAFDEMEKVGEGTVERYIIDLEKFTRQMRERKRPRGEVIN